MRKFLLFLFLIFIAAPVSAQELSDAEAKKTATDLAECSGLFLTLSNVLRSTGKERQIRRSIKADHGVAVKS